MRGAGGGLAPEGTRLLNSSDDSTIRVWDATSGLPVGFTIVNRPRGRKVAVFDQVLTRVTRVAPYTSFEEMFDHEQVASVNPTANRAEQLANIRQIYPPEREALGVVAIGIELVDPPRPV